MNLKIVSAFFFILSLLNAGIVWATHGSIFSILCGLPSFFFFLVYTYLAFIGFTPHRVEGMPWDQAEKELNKNGYNNLQVVEFGEIIFLNQEVGRWTIFLDEKGKVDRVEEG